MNYNPYAAPQEQPPLPPGGGPGGPLGAPQPWEIGEVVGLAWDAFKANWVVLVFAQALTTILGIICSQTPGFAVGGISPNNSPLVMGMQGGGTVLSFVIAAFFQGGLARMWLTAARGGTPSFSDIFSGGPFFLRMLALSFFQGLIVTIGIVLFVIPGIILLIGLALSSLFVFDAQMSAVDAMRASWKATTGQKLPLFAFFIVVSLIGLAGLLACCVGVLVTLPISYVALAIVYLRLTGQGAAVARAGYGAPPPGYGGPPGGGYGGPPGGGYGGPPGGGYSGPPGGGYGGPPGGGYGGPPGGGYGGPPGGGYGGPGGPS